MENNFRAEAEIFGQYLLKKLPDEQLIARYVSAMEKTETILTPKENRLRTFMLKNNWSIGMIDSALAVFDRNSNIRKRIFLMFAILETSLINAEMFLPRNTNMFYSLYIVFSAIRSVTKSFFGYFLIKLI